MNTRALGDLDEANAAALAMIDMLPLYALLELRATMAKTDLKFERMGIDVPPSNARLIASVESRIVKLQGTLQ